MRARRGDARAYESLVEEHQAIAFRTAYLITGSAAEAEEAAQEAFVRAWLALRRFRREPSSAPGCSRSSPTRPAIGYAAAGGAKAWPSARPSELSWQAPRPRARRSATAVCETRSPPCRSATAASSPAASCSISASRRPRPCWASRAAPSSRERRGRSSVCERPGGRGMTLERDLRALAAGFPEPPDAQRARARGCAGGVAAEARRRRVARARARALPARPGDRPGGLARPARPRARDLRAPQCDGRARHAPAAVSPAARSLRARIAHLPGRRAAR